MDHVHSTESTIFTNLQKFEWYSYSTSETVSRIPLTKLVAHMSEIRTVCKVSLRKRRHKRSGRTPRCRQDDNNTTSLPSLWLCAFDWAGSIHDLVILFSLWWTSLYNSGALLANSSQDQMLICFDFFESAIKAGSNRVYSSIDT